MKKILLLNLFIVSAVTLSAQFGINAGINLANLGGEDASEADLGVNEKKVLAGPHIGVFYKAVLGDQFSIQPEVGFSPAGLKFVDSGVKGKLLLNYICLGALVNWISSSGFYLGTGPQLGLLMTAKSKVDGQPDVDFKDDTKNADFGWMFRAGYDLPAGYGFYGGFNLGLGTIDDNSPSDEIKNRVIQFGVRYLMNKGGKKKK